MDKHLTIKLFTKTLPPLEDIKLISRQCHWWTVSDEDYASLFQESLLTLIAYENNEPVGTARLISDGVVYGVLVDFLVLPEKQREGIGSALMKEILTFCRDKNLKMLKLLATPKGKGLYQKFGFKVRSKEEPGMILFVEESLSRPSSPTSLSSPKS